MNSNKSEQDLIKQIIAILNIFRSLENTETKVEIRQDNDGKFLVNISTHNKRISINHGWYKDSNYSFKHPGTIDVSLTISSSGASTVYMVIMSECDLNLFPLNLSNAYEITKAFLNDDYEINVKKHLFKDKSYLNLKVEGLYKVAIAN